MKAIRNKFILLLTIWSISSSAQNQTNIWQMGIISFNNYPKFLIDFNSGQPDTLRFVRQMPFFITNTSICDSSGQLLFYTNGVYIANANHDTLQNSTNYNPGDETTDSYPDGNSIPQGALILPKPASDSLFLIFNESGMYFNAHGQLQAQPLFLSYSQIDITLDNGLGGITASKKNIHLITDTLLHGRITACKHANGRDWWVVVARFYSNSYYKILVTPDSIYSPYNIQQIGDTIKYDALGQAIFSPDGTKYANIGANSNVEIFHFDRCTGDFTASEHIYLAQGANGIFGGAFSPNSRFLYVNNYNYIFQFDTDSFPTDSTKITVATWIPFNAPFPTEFFMMQLASNNKIYISTYNGNHVLHVINFPDSLGLACNITQNSFITPIDNTTIPTFPNYNLGADSGSVCDTLMLNVNQTIMKTDEKVWISIFPNPAQDYFIIKFKISSNQPEPFIIYDTFGKSVLRRNLIEASQQFIVNTTTLVNGIYYWKFQNQSGKLVILK